MKSASIRARRIRSASAPLAATSISSRVTPEPELDLDAQLAAAAAVSMSAVSPRGSRMVRRAATVLLSEPTRTMGTIPS